MSRKASVNIEGDDGCYSLRKLREIALEVSEKFWKCPMPLPDSFKVDVSIVGREEISRINKEFLGRDGPTDVIAFSLCEGEETPAEVPCLLGQIIICRHVAEENARRYKHNPGREMNLLFIHGMLHLCGWGEGGEIEKNQEEMMEKYFPNEER